MVIMMISHGWVVVRVDGGVGGFRHLVVVVVAVSGAATTDAAVAGDDLKQKVHLSAEIHDTGSEQHSYERTLALSPKPQVQAIALGVDASWNTLEA